VLNDGSENMNRNVSCQAIVINKSMWRRYLDIDLNMRMTHLYLLQNIHLFKERNLVELTAIYHLLQRNGCLCKSHLFTYLQVDLCFTEDDESYRMKNIWLNFRQLWRNFTCFQSIEIQVTH